MGLLDWLTPWLPIANAVGAAANNIADRFIPKKMSEAERMEKYAQLFNISEASTDSARKMFMTEMQTQKQPWIIRLLNGLVRPLGGLGALLTEFYAIWGSNMGEWLHFKHIPVSITVEQHLVLGAIIAFYFGSRLKETLNGVSTTR